MAEVEVLEPVAVPEAPVDSMIVKDGLRFVFQGYAIWLDVEQFQVPSSEWGSGLRAGRSNDLERAISVSSQELNVYPIPAPHLTALYGINHLSESDTRKRFQDLAESLQGEEWPILEPDGFTSDVEIAGINGGLMNMAWMEATFKTSDEHERLIDHMFDCFFKGTGDVRQSKWAPHISLAYDNEDCPIPKEYLYNMVERFPSLAYPRKVQSLSLWDLNGTIDQWTLLDRIPLRQSTASANVVSDVESVME
eukprot:CAMPEP_0176178206 /NCGR_PEP_ID=MMETSP0120_2-20121206/91311_1 /TAXON_ID=160619 /ORGANISM="Kryptoperidinium foliaceum, Strain CCMP 1326" /LENGTH=249 /DNA_ID=CAMNT_0017516355 /DNA_START=13 /DNA_END=762 /DNA_ORIENTATION=-